jgi:hypothetical protein
MKQTCLFFLVFLLSVSCSMKEDLEGDVQLDLSPPRLISMDSCSGQEVFLYFDEPLSLSDDAVILDNGVAADLTIRNENCLVLTPENSLEPGAPRTTALSIEDKRGNSNNFLIRFWGWNPSLPSLVINEFNPEGSGNNTDTVELFFMSDGDTAGLTLYYGTKSHYDYRYILPSISVAKGDYLLIHCRPEGIPEEKNELLRKDLSGGKLSSDEAWDLWLSEDAGLSGRNGVLTFYSSPTGNVMDCVIYSNREPDPDDDKLGWTRGTFDAVADLYQSGDWKFSDENISPREVVRSDYTTGTRSICRSSTSNDTDSSEDWHTVPTGGKSFGSVNSDKVYVP